MEAGQTYHSDVLYNNRLTYSLGNCYRRQFDCAGGWNGLDLAVDWCGIRVRRWWRLNEVRWEEADGVDSERREKEQWEMESLGAQISRVSTREESDNEYR